MSEKRHHDPQVEPRVLRGKEHWWFLGAGGVAKLRPWHIDDDGRPSETATNWLRSQGIYRAPTRKAYALTVLTTTHCNLGCAYCFQNLAQDDTGGTAPPRISYARLNSATIEKILAFTKQRMAEVDLTQLHITLFGGEPLLNPLGCEALLAAATPLGLRRADMVSNGSHMPVPLMRRLAALGLRSVQITFDGDQADHDLSRVMRTGGGTFDTIVANIHRLHQEADIRFSFRVNVTNDNVRGIDGLIDRLAARLDPRRCGIYFKIVGDVGNGFSNDMAGVDDLAQRFIAWNRQALAHGFGVGRPQPRVLCPACSFPGGTYGAVVNADGTLSSCWETAGKPEWQVGTVTDGYVSEQTMSSRWMRCEDDYRNFADAEWWETFHNVVDAALLDDLAAAGRL